MDKDTLSRPRENAASATGEEIERLIRWVERDQWQDDVGEVIQQHPGKACAPPGMRGDEELADFDFTRLGRNSA